MVNSDILKCPVCGGVLAINKNSYVCKNKHTFDIASKGYVNLLLSNQKNSKEPGDNKQMVAARNNFLSGGFYKKLSDNINTIVVEYINSYKKIDDVNILDAGCGEGYYIDSLEKELKDKSIKADLFGIDISKDAIKFASSRNKNICLAVASSYNIPVISQSINCLLQIFAPCSNDEFFRVVKNDGILISVIPGKNHLFGLKQLLYDNPYANDEVEYPLVSFKPINQIRVEYEITLDSTDNIKNLLMMTPYYWRTDIQRIKRLDEINKLETPMEFIITTYSKNKLSEGHLKEV